MSVLVLMRDEEHAALPPSTSRVVDPTDSTKFVDIPVLGATYALGMDLIGIHELTDGVSRQMHTLNMHYYTILISSSGSLFVGLLVCHCNQNK